MEIIRNSDVLKQRCYEFSKFPAIAVDTEFTRSHTYYPKPCLIQIANEAGSFIFDFIEKEKDVDLEPLLSLIMNKDITKIFHSGKQDLEIIYNLTGAVPENVFDTQIAAMACGFGTNIGYAKLVSLMLEVNLEKSYKFTDWEVRPLTEDQMRYALDDVIYLHTLYLKMFFLLKEKNRSLWLEEETQMLLDINNYKPDIENIWKRIKVKSYNQKYLGLVKNLAGWRETKAIELDKPRQHIIKDLSILNIASSGLENSDNLKNLVDKLSLSKSLKKEIMSIARNFGGEVKLENVKEESSFNADTKVLSMLKILLEIKSCENKVSKSLVANSKDLSLIVSGKLDKTKCSKGWRWEIFGKYALKMQEGKISLIVRNNEVVIQDSQI